MLVLGIGAMLVIMPVTFIEKLTTKRIGVPPMMAHFMTWVARLVWGWTVSLKGEVALMGPDHEPCVYICNHQSLLDLVRGCRSTSLY